MENGHAPVPPEEPRSHSVILPPIQDPQQHYQAQRSLQQLPPPPQFASLQHPQPQHQQHHHLPPLLHHPQSHPSHHHQHLPPPPHPHSPYAHHVHAPPPPPPSTLAQVGDENAHVPDTEQNAQWDYVSQSTEQAAKESHGNTRRGSSVIQPSNSSVVNGSTPRRKMGQDLASFPTVPHPIAFAIWVTQQLYNIYNTNVQSYSFVNTGVDSMNGDSAMKRKGDQKLRKLRNRQKNWVKNKENDARASLTVKARGIYGAGPSAEKSAWIDNELQARIGRTMDRYVLRIAPNCRNKHFFDYGFGQAFFDQGNFAPEVAQAGKLFTAPLPALLGDGLNDALYIATNQLSHALAVSNLRPFDEALRALSNDAVIMEAAVSAISVLYSMDNNNFVPLPRIEAMAQQQQQQVRDGSYDESPRTGPQAARKSAASSRLSTPTTAYALPPPMNSFQPINAEPPSTPISKVVAPPLASQSTGTWQPPTPQIVETPVTVRTETPADTTMLENPDIRQTPGSASKRRSARFADEPVEDVAFTSATPSPVKEATNTQDHAASLPDKPSVKEAQAQPTSNELDKKYSAETMRLARNLIQATIDALNDQGDFAPRKSKRRKTGKSALSQVYNATSNENGHMSDEEADSPVANEAGQATSDQGATTAIVNDKTLPGDALVNTLISAEKSRQISDAYRNLPKSDEVANIDAQVAGATDNLTHAHILRPYTDAYGWKHTGLINGHGEELSEVPPTYMYAEVGVPKIKSAQSLEKSNAYGYPPALGQDQTTNEIDSPQSFQLEDIENERNKPRARAAAWERGIQVQGKFDLKEVEAKVLVWDQARAQETTNGRGSGGSDVSVGTHPASDSGTASASTPQPPAKRGKAEFINTNQENFLSNRARSRRKRHYVESPTPSDVTTNDA